MSKDLGTFLHVVMMQFDETVGENFHLKVMEYADLVRDECSGIIMYHYGANLASRSDGFTHATSCLFIDEAAHDAYQISPAHVAMKTFMSGHIERVAVHDCLVPHNIGLSDWVKP